MDHENPLPLSRILSSEDVERGAVVLREIDPSLCVEMDQIGEIPLRLRPPGFAGLAEIVTGQQVSKASAAAMFSRLRNEVIPLDAETLLRLGEEPLVRAGLSKAKQKTLNGIALAIVDDGLDLDALCDVPPTDAMAVLTDLHGIGPWTAEVFLLFCAGHVDIFPAGDIALQQAMMDIGITSERPAERQARKIAEKWAPVRGVAARVLWAIYARYRSRSDIPV